MIFPSPEFSLAAAAGAIALGVRLVSRHDGGTPPDRRIGGISWLCSGVWLALQWSTIFLPVVTDMRAPVVQRGDGFAVFDVTATKARPDCDFEYTSAQVIDADGLGQKAWWEALNDKTPGASRPAGPQRMGLWRVKFSEEVSGPQLIYFYSHHDCGWLFGRTVTKSGPFGVPKLSR